MRLTFAFPPREDQAEQIRFQNDAMRGTKTSVKERLSAKGVLFFLVTDCSIFLNPWVNCEVVVVR